MEDWELKERARLVADHWRRLQEIEGLMKSVPEILQRKEAEIYEQLRAIFTTPPTKEE